MPSAGVNADATPTRFSVVELAEKRMELAQMREKIAKAEIKAMQGQKTYDASDTRYQALKQVAAKAAAKVKATANKSALVKLQADVAALKKIHAELDAEVSGVKPAHEATLQHLAALSEPSNKDAATEAAGLHLEL